MTLEWEGLFPKQESEKHKAYGKQHNRLRDIRNMSTLFDPPIWSRELLTVP